MLLREEWICLVEVEEVTIKFWVIWFSAFRLIMMIFSDDDVVLNNGFIQLLLSFYVKRGRFSS